MFFARIQLTGGPDKHSISQSERINPFDSRPDRKPVYSLFVFFDSHSIPSRLILNLFDSSTDERFIKANNEIKIAIESTEHD